MGAYTSTRREEDKPEIGCSLASGQFRWYKEITKTNWEACIEGEGSMDGREEERERGQGLVQKFHWSTGFFSLSLADLLLLHSTSPAWYRSYYNHYICSSSSTTAAGKVWIKLLCETQAIPVWRISHLELWLPWKTLELWNSERHAHSATSC